MNAVTTPNHAPAIQISGFDQLMRFGQIASKSGMVPTQYSNKPEAIIIAVQMGSELGLAPMQSLQNIAVINGRPSVWGDALLGLVKASPVCDDVVETIEGSGDSMTAICVAKRKGKAPVEARFSVEDAKGASLWTKPGPWKQYPRRMLQMRARGFALRDAFPDVLRGLITAEEAADMPEDNYRKSVSRPTDITPQRPEIEHRPKEATANYVAVARQRLAKCSRVEEVITQREGWAQFVQENEEAGRPIHRDIQDEVNKMIDDRQDQLADIHGHSVQQDDLAKVPA